jgi:hypothetical protein
MLSILMCDTTRQIIITCLFVLVIWWIWVLMREIYR